MCAVLARGIREGFLDEGIYVNWGMNEVRERETVF